MSDDEYTIRITQKTFEALMTGKRVKMVKLRGMGVSLQLDPEARAILSRILERAFSKLADDGWLRATAEAIARGEFKINEDGDLTDAAGKPLRFTKDPKENLH